MTNSRSFLWLGLLLVAYLIWNQWQQDYAHSPVPPVVEAATANAPGDVPTHIAAPNSSDALAAPLGVAAPTPIDVAGATLGERIEITTDVLRLAIDLRGASVVEADLLAYPQQPRDLAHPVRLLDASREHFFVAQSGLISAKNVSPDHQTLFVAEQTNYALADGENRLEVPLTWDDPVSGLTVRKVFVLERGNYVIGARQEITNHSDAVWTGNAYRQLQRVAPQHKGFSFTSPEQYSFVGAAWYSPEDKFQKLKFEKFEKDPLNRPIKDGWAALLQHYFFAAWIPPVGETDQYSTATVIDTASTPYGTTRYLIRTVGPGLSVAPGATVTSQARLYIGPKLQSTLGDVAPGLALTADYGIFTFIAEPLHWVLSTLHALTSNWGFAIILLVLLIKLAFFKLSEAQYRSMAKMRKLQPRVQALKERYGDDRQKMNQAMMELYQKEKINPLGGCLPMLVQIPVFFALYWVLIESVELRHAPFILWIQNLTAPDPYFVLPILNGATMIATQYLTPTTGMDPVQAKMMKIMPVAFAVMFAFFPAGLVLYWTVNGLASLIQQWVITKRIEAVEKA